MYTETLEPDRREINDAADAAYAEVARVVGADAEEVHKLDVCYRVADTMLQGLGASGRPLNPTHEVRTAPGAAEHSYLSFPQGNSPDFLADPTWQQFLPRAARVDGLPKVLMGSRDQVALQAKLYGVPSELLTLWQKKDGVMTVDEQKARDHAASEAADRAASMGAWENFTDGGNTATRRKIGTSVLRSLGGRRYSGGKHRLRP